MRNLKTFVTDVVRKPPMVLPFVALAHVLALVWTAIHASSANDIIEMAWILAHTICWLAACDLRIWGVHGYLAITVANTLMYLSLKNVYDRDMYTSDLFLIDAVFGIFLVLYYKKFH